MLYLFISVLCSVSVGVLFKYLKAHTTVNIFLIAVNYLCAIIAAWISFKPQLAWNGGVWNPVVLSLSVLLPVVFILLTLSIRFAGIIKTDIAQRISLVIPIVCAYWLFGEIIPLLRWAGIIAGFIAMFFILNRPSEAKGKHFVYLLLVFLGYGVIDVLFKQVALQKQIPYTTSLFYIFCGSFIVALLITIFSWKKYKMTFQRSVIFYGCLLGLLNFLNIYFYLKAHAYFSQNPTTVFATMNFGVIFLGTLIGAFYFKEKLSAKNIFGLVLALVAIGLVVISQLG